MFAEFTESPDIQERAEHGCAEAFLRFGSHRTRFRPAHLGRLGARIAEHQHVTESVEPGFIEAIRLFRETGYRFWLGITLLEHAEWLAASGRPGESSAVVAESTAIFNGLRAEPWKARASRLARSLATIASLASEAVT
jgi:hypothetical protein